MSIVLKVTNHCQALTRKKPMYSISIYRPLKPNRQSDHPPLTARPFSFPPPFCSSLLPPLFLLAHPQGDDGDYQAAVEQLSTSQMKQVTMQRWLQALKLCVSHLTEDFDLLVGATLVRIIPVKRSSKKILLPSFSFLNFLCPLACPLLLSHLLSFLSLLPLSLPPSLPLSLPFFFLSPSHCLPIFFPLPSSLLPPPPLPRDLHGTTRILVWSNST